MNANICDTCQRVLPEGTGFEVESLSPLRTMDDKGTYHYCNWTCMFKDAEASSAGGSR